MNQHIYLEMGNTWPRGKHCTNGFLLTEGENWGSDKVLNTGGLLQKGKEQYLLHILCGLDEELKGLNCKKKDSGISEKLLNCKHSKIRNRSCPETLNFLHGWKSLKMDQASLCQQLDKYSWSCMGARSQTGWHLRLFRSKWFYCLTELFLVSGSRQEIHFTYNRKGKWNFLTFLS